MFRKPVDGLRGMACLSSRFKKILGLGPININIIGLTPRMEGDGHKKYKK